MGAVVLSMGCCMKKARAKKKAVKVKPKKVKKKTEQKPTPRDFECVRHRERNHPDYDPFTKTGHYGVWDPFMKTYR